MKQTPHAARTFQIKTMIFLILSLILAFASLPANAQDHNPDDANVSNRYGRTVILFKKLLKSGESVTFKDSTYIQTIRTIPDNQLDINQATITDVKGKVVTHKNFGMVFLFEATGVFSGQIPVRQLTYKGKKEIEIKYFRLPIATERTKIAKKQRLQPTKKYSLSKTPQ